ncbi:MAG: hypothetical protein JO034_25755 [Singulisphaera sp.]|nr:hypothetical protein [Singulisphaera sp.]
MQQYTLPEASVSLITPDTYAVTVPASGRLSGFSATVPISSVRFLNNGFVTVAIPQSAIPPNALKSCGSRGPPGGGGPTAWRTPGRSW